MENLIVRELQSPIQGFTICIVDGSLVRKNYDIDFTNYGQFYRFPFIPPNQIWIDCEAHPNEYRFFIKDAIVEFLSMKKGSSFEQALEQVKKEDQKNRAAVHQSLSLDKKLLYNKYKIFIYIVNGDYVRTYIDPTFVEGGHGYVYDYIAKNTVWIDDALFSKDIGFVVYHELIERYLMATKKLKYHPAHKIASDLEATWRRAA